ncbi:fibronectin type III domain-containing protein [Aporhodopirellula aestuarii]|uniref:Fibronectin type III domain-containing protein n=1 Tax=Aporhodopirellula aestuarii TaxID=2950107 RepID=A0ABT0UCC5_9BACT|nr:fibronectin type III domain-containing protein [Aporhodopirellula aestuarii]MCM2374662.1 fibronectin type III domain-containing protein [Aporhodopirellula aestuarii]
MTTSAKRRRLSNHITRKPQAQNLEDRRLMDADDSFGGAVFLGTDRDIETSGWVRRWSDPHDFRSFRITERSKVIIEANNLTNDVDIHLLAQDQSRLDSSTRSGTRNERIDAVLNAGTYVVDVDAESWSWARYGLSINIDPVASKPDATVVRATRVSTDWARLTWNNVAGEDSYSVWQYHNGRETRLGTLNANQTTFTARNLSPGSSYYFRVDATNEAGTSRSRWQYVRTQRERVDISPGISLEKISEGSVRVGWSNASFEDGYRVQRWGTRGWENVKSVGRDQTSTIVSGLQSGQTHYFRVEAFNGQGTDHTSWKSISLVTDWSQDSSVVNARNQLSSFSSWDANVYRQLRYIPLNNSQGSRSADAYARVIEQFKVEDRSHRTNISNRYTKGGYDNLDTRCNIFAGDVMRGMGANLPQKPNGDQMFQNANSMNLWLNSQSGRNAGWRAVDVTTQAGLAQVLAHVRAGRPALASLEASRPTAGGHIAVIRPDQPSTVRSVGDLRVAQAGDDNFANGTLTRGFGGTRGVQVFIHD